MKGGIGFGKLNVGDTFFKVEGSDGNYSINRYYVKALGEHGQVVSALTDDGAVVERNDWYGLCYFWTTYKTLKEAVRHLRTQYKVKPNFEPEKFFRNIKRKMERAKDKEFKVGDEVYFISNEKVVKGKIILMGDYWAFVSSYHKPIPHLLLYRYPDDVSKELEAREKKEEG